MVRPSLFLRIIRNTDGNALCIFSAALVPLIALIGSGLDLGVGFMV